MIASVAIGLTSFGLRYSFGIFFNSLETEFGLSRAALSGIFSTYMLLCGALSVFGGWCLDRYGPKKVATIMGVFVGLSLLASSQVSSPWQLYITYSILMALGTGAIFSVANSTASRWFVKKRGFVLGITSGAGAMGEVILAPVSTLLIAHFDWRMSFIILGVMAWVILLPMSQLMKRDPSEIGLLPDGIKPEANPGKPSKAKLTIQEGLTLSQAYRVREFWFMVLIWLLLSVSVHMILTHIVPHAIDLGISPMDAAFIVSLVGIGAVTGRIIDGKLSDSIGRKIPAVTSGLLQFAALIALLFVSKIQFFYVVALFFGYGWGGLGAQVTILIGDIFGTRSIGAIMGTITAGWSLGAAIGPAFAGMVYDATGSYSVSFAVAAAGMLVATILAAVVRTERATVRSKLPVTAATS